MSDDTADGGTEGPFTDPEGSNDWVDVRMTDPQEGEWDVDVVVAAGRVEYVDLRVKPALLTGFIDCLVEDMSDEQARRVLERLADRQGIDPGDGGAGAGDAA